MCWKYLRKISSPKTSLMEAKWRGLLSWTVVKIKMLLFKILPGDTSQKILMQKMPQFLVMGENRFLLLKKLKTVPEPSLIEVKRFILLKILKTIWKSSLGEVNKFLSVKLKSNLLMEICKLCAARTDLIQKVPPHEGDDKLEIEDGEFKIIKEKFLHLNNDAEVVSKKSGGLYKDQSMSKTESS